MEHGGFSMERFYLKIVGSHASVYHRGTHQLIEFLPDPNTQECKDRVIELMSMSTEEFYTYVVSRGVKPVERLIEEIDKDKEGWYTGAWKYHTERFMKHNNIDIEMPNEDIPYELIGKLLRKNVNGWNSGLGKPKEEPKKEIKKLPTKKQVNPLEELERKFKDGQMSIGEYIKQKRLLANA